MQVILGCLVAPKWSRHPSTTIILLTVLGSEKEYFNKRP